MAGRTELLVVADSLDGGLGAAAVAHARWFAAHGWEVTLAVPAGVPGATRVDRLVDVRLENLPTVSSAFEMRQVVRAASALRRLLRRHPTVVHAHGTRSQLLLLVAGRRAFVTMHGSGGRIRGQSTLGASARRLSRRVAAWLAIRPYAAAPADGRWVTTLHASPRLASLNQMPAVRGVPTFLWVGRLDAPKHPEVFVNACAIAARKIQLRGVVVGDGPMMEAIRSQALKSGAQVDVVGVSDQIDSYLRDAWAVCLFSDFEGVPFSVQEAMWAGRAVLVSPLPSLRWFAADVASYAHDADAAAEAMIHLSDRRVAMRCGAAAANRIRRLLEVDSPFPTLLRDYEDLLAITDR